MKAIVLALTFIFWAKLGLCVPIDLNSILASLFGGGATSQSSSSASSPPPPSQAAPQTSAPTPQGNALISSSCFDSQTSLESYFSYNYPWGTTHNGAARMASQYSVAEGGTLTLTSTYTGASDYAYNSGTVFAKQNFKVTSGGGLDFSAQFMATTIKGTWPAFWLTAVASWPPEIDIAEWKGDGNIFFNTFNTSSQIAADPIPYPNPQQWHSVFCSLRDAGNGADVTVDFWLDGTHVTTQWGKSYLNRDFFLIIDLQMEGGSGSPGPMTSEFFPLTLSWGGVGADDR